MLLEGKADPTVADKDGNTILHCAKTSELMTALLSLFRNVRSAHKAATTMTVTANTGAAG